MNIESELLWEQYQLILEKDHRQKIIKFGVDEDVANYLHEFNDKYSLWFADKIKNMEGYKRATNKVAWIRGNISHDMTTIVDWVRNVPNIHLKLYDWESALHSSQEYHEKLQAQSLEGVERNHIIKKYNDGFYWVDLKTNNCREEGSLMGHCGTTAADTIFSLRKYDPHTQTIEGFVTMAISPNEGYWRQARGKKNSKPKDVYHKYIVDILVEHGVFTYQSEYGGIGGDFTDSDFKGWLEDNPEVYPNSSEIIEKLGSSGLVAKARKLFEEYTFNRFSIDWSVEGAGGWETIFASAQAELEFDISNIEDIYNINDDVQKFKEVFFDTMLNYGIIPYKDAYDDHGDDWYSIIKQRGDDKTVLYIELHFEIDNYHSNGEPIWIFTEFLDRISEIEETITSNKDHMDNYMIYKLKKARIIESNFTKLVNTTRENLDDLLFFDDLTYNEKYNQVVFTGEIELFEVSKKNILDDDEIGSIYEDPNEGYLGLYELGLEDYKRDNHPFYFIGEWFMRYAPKIKSIYFKVNKDTNILSMFFNESLRLSEEGELNEYKDEWDKFLTIDKTLSGVKSIFPQFFRDNIQPQFDNIEEVKMEDFSYEYSHNEYSDNLTNITITVKYKDYGVIGRGNYFYDDRKGKEPLKAYTKELIKEIIRKNTFRKPNPDILEKIKNHLGENESVDDNPRQMKLKLESKKVKFKEIFYN